MKKIALCYDFDGTLCSGYMQDQKLLHDCKIEPKDFWIKVAKVDPIKQQPSTNLVKSEPTKPESTTVSSPEQKTTQSNLLYYILGLLTLGITSAYFYFRNKGKNTDIKLHTSNELNKTLQEQTSSDSTLTSSEEIKK